MNRARFAFALVTCSVLISSSICAADSVPVIYCTDLFHPHDDADDHIDLATLFTLPELDVKAIILDNGPQQRLRPGSIPVRQMLAITGRTVPFAVGLAPLKSPTDTGESQPKEDQAGVELILKVLRESEQPVTIITAGSVRDVVAAWRRGPDLFRNHVGAIHVNIGNSDVGGDEYNVAIDRAAYVSLLRSGLPVCLYPCFPADGPYSTYFRFHQFPDIVKTCPLELRNYFVYAIRRTDPRTVDPMASLKSMKIEQSDECLAASPAFRGGKEMWCTPSFLQAAGRTIVRERGEYRMARGPIDAHDVAPVFDLPPARVEVDEQGKLTKVEVGAVDPNVRLFHRCDVRDYTDAMNDCLRELLLRRPSAAGAAR